MKPGTKPGTKFSVAHCKAIAEGLHRAMANGWRPIKHTPEEHQRRVIMAGQTMAGRPQRLDTVCGKHKDNKNAKWWKFENKGLGKTLEGKNLSQLVRDNENLFDPADVQWSKSRCRVEVSLRLLKCTKKRTRNSWKGWVLCTPDGAL